MPIISAPGQLGSGLDEQLTNFLREHPDTSLIIIDTLQKVREVGGDNYSYANDYQIITRLKALADSYGICLLLVHHTRKQQSDDKFDMISGTNGLLGAADGAFLLTKEKRTGNAACLDVSGRDQPDQRLHLFRNEETLAWELERVETELWKAPPEPLLEQVSAFLFSTGKDWVGTPTELSALLGVDMKTEVSAGCRVTFSKGSPAGEATAVAGATPHRAWHCAALSLPLGERNSIF